MTTFPMTYHTGIQGHEDWPVGHFGYSETDNEGRKEADLYCFIRMNESMCVLPIVKGKRTETAWYWDGNLEKPTLKPSVLHQPSETILPWHGFVTEGELVTS